MRLGKRLRAWPGVGLDSRIGGGGEKGKKGKEEMEREREGEIRKKNGLPGRLTRQRFDVEGEERRDTVPHLCVRACVWQQVERESRDNKRRLSTELAGGGRGGGMYRVNVHKCAPMSAAYACVCVCFIYIYICLVFPVSECARALVHFVSARFVQIEVPTHR